MHAALFKNLNKQQYEAVTNQAGPSIILAGAGSGKTRVLICKVLNLTENLGVSPFEIMMITFTNKAAAEMKNRMGLKKLGYIGTFHSFCAMVLRRDGAHLGVGNKFIIYDEADQLNLVKKILKNLDSKKFSPSYFLSRISAAKNLMIVAKNYLQFFSDYNASLVAEVYQKYENELGKSGALDFDDLLLKTVELFKINKQVLEKYQNRARYILVDEFQDTNYVQYILIKLLAEKFKNVTVVGDFSQSIYSWRGADIKNLEKFKQDFPKCKIFNLEQNYRSSQKILDFAYKVISKNQTHPILELFTTNNPGEDVQIREVENEEYEGHFVASEIQNAVGNRHVYSLQYSSFAVLYRTNAQSRVIEEVFLHYGIPYILIGGTRFYERREIKDVLSYIRLVANPDDDLAKDRLVKLGKRRWNEFKNLLQTEIESLQKLATNQLIEEIFAKTRYLDLYNREDEEDYARIENIKELKSVALSFPEIHKFLEQVALVESEYFEDEKKGKNKDTVKLMTLHQAKGLEFPIVFIVGVEEGILPHVRSIDDLYSLEEERRLFYVGITRAKQKLYITYSGQRFIFGRRNASIKSRFLGDEEIVATF